MRPSLITLGIWVAILALALGGYGLARASVAAQSASVAELERQIEARRESSNHVALARSALAELAGDEAVVQSHFVTPSGVVTFIDDLQARAHALDAVVEVESVAATAGREARPALLLTFAVTGAFDAVMRTIGSIEYAPYDISITELSLAHDVQDVWAASVHLSVGSAATTTPSR